MASRNQSTQSLRSEDIMKASAWLFSAAICASSLALAQTAPQSRVTESTDPAKAAEVERHAQELAARAQTTPEKKQSSHPSKSKSKKKPAKKEKAPSDTPMAPESKG
jgi:hypothetical protein